MADEQGRKNQSRFTRWVSGGGARPSNKVEMEEVTLVPDLETYQPGDTAQILVQSPFTPAEGLLTVTRSGILYTERFKIEDGSTTLEIPIKVEYIPNLNVRVDLTGSAPRTGDDGEPLVDLPYRPAYASAELNLQIPPLERTLSLEVSPTREKLEPGSSTSLTVSLKDADGNVVVIGGKTGSGDNRFEYFAKGGKLISSRVVNRTATFAFFIGDRYFGVLTAFMPGEAAAEEALAGALQRRFGALGEQRQDPVGVARAAGGGHGWERTSAACGLHGRGVPNQGRGETRAVPAVADPRLRRRKGEQNQQKLRHP